MKKPDKSSLELLVIEHDPLARITYQIASELESHLPIESFDKLQQKLGNITIDNQKIPLAIFTPHVGAALFPITTVEDLVSKLSAGVRQAVAAPPSPARHETLDEIVTKAKHGDPTARPGIPVGFITRSPLVSGSPIGKGDK